EIALPEERVAEVAADYGAVHGIRRHLEPAPASADRQIPFIPEGVDPANHPSGIAPDARVSDRVTRGECSPLGLEGLLESPQRDVVDSHDPLGHPQPPSLTGSFQERDRLLAVLQSLPGLARPGCL